MPTAGCASATKVQLVQNRASATGPAAGPATIMPTSTTKCSGMPQAISRSVTKPRCCSQGLTTPQHQKVTSIAMLIVNRPPAAASAS